MDVDSAFSDRFDSRTAVAFLLLNQESAGLHTPRILNFNHPELNEFSPQH
jgi:hypothetical protein